MKLLTTISVLFLTLSFANSVWSQEKAHDEQHSPEEEDHGHEEEGHGHEEEESSSIGPDKGILAASEKEGFKLSAEAIKNFGLETQQLTSSKTWSIPSSARLFAGEEVNLYRLRNGFFKRIDFHLITHAPNQITISSESLRAGDEIVVKGVGFLRIAELAAFGGVADGHSH